MKPFKAPSEHQCQVAVFQWAAYQQGRFPFLNKLYAIPNGSLRTRIGGIMLKREGVKPGVPDICLPEARGGYFGLYIEMKKPGNSETKFQALWQHRLNRSGYLARVCVGTDEAIAVLESYCQSKSTL